MGIGLDLTGVTANEETMRCAASGQWAGGVRSGGTSPVRHGTGAIRPEQLDELTHEADRVPDGANRARRFVRATILGA